MAITAPLINEITTREGPSQDERGFRFTRRFDAITTTPLAAYALLAQQFGVQRNAIYVSPFGEVPDIRVVCTNLSMDVRKLAVPGGFGHYIITAGYDITERREPEPDPNGTPVYEWDGLIKNEQVDTDIDGKPIVNSVDVPFDATDTIGYAMLNVKWYRASFDPRLIVQYTNAVNGTNWTPADPFGDGATLFAGEAFCQSIRRTPVNDELVFINASFMLQELITFPDGQKSAFDLHKHDRGTRKFIGVKDGIRIFEDFVDARQNKLSEPRLLDGNGAPLPTGQDPVILHFTMKKRRNFQNLGI